MSVLTRLRMLVRGQAGRPGGGSAVAGSPDAEYEAQLRTIETVRRSIADVMITRKRLEAQADELRRRIADLHAQAGDAAARGRDDLARSALKDSLGIERLLAKRQAVIDDLHRREADLNESSTKLQAGSEEYRARLDAARARAVAAEAAVAGRSVVAEAPPPPERDGNVRP